MLQLSASRRAALTAEAEKYHAARTGRVLDYLESRGITTAQQETYLLGEVSEPDHANEYLQGRLSIPFVTPSGIVAIRFRCVEDHSCREAGHPKYVQRKGETDHLYNVLALRERHPAIAVCEGEIDAMMVDTHVMPAMGVTGVSKWKPHWSRLLEGFERVFAVGDGDQAGREFTARLVEMLPNAKAVVFPDGLDANAFFLQEGAEALEQFVLG